MDLEPDGEFHVTRNAVAHLLAERGWTDAALAAGAGLDRAHVNQGVTKKEIVNYKVPSAASGRPPQKALFGDLLLYNATKMLTLQSF